MKTLVIGGTGTVGSLVVQELVRQQASVRVLVTSPEKAAQLPTGVEAVVGNLDQPGTLPSAFTGIDSVFLLNRQGPNEAAQGQFAIAAAKRAGVRKIVYQSIHNARMGAHIPHFRPKITIENVLIQSGLDYVFICPNNFYQNDLWFSQAISTYGIYPQPIGDIGLNRVDVRDIAEVAAKALLTDDFNGQSIPLVGPDVLTGSETAAILSEQLEGVIYYWGNDLNQWATDARKVYPDWLVSDWLIMYQFFQERGLTASEQDLARCTKALGHIPRSYAEFVTDHLLDFHPTMSVA